MLYQILMLKNGDETVRKRFMSYAWTVAHGGVSLDEYETAYSSHIEPVGTVAETLEAIYVKFNTDRPEDYTGRSLSVSDLVMLDGVGAYFCDSFGFRKLDNQLTIFDL